MSARKSKVGGWRKGAGAKPILNPRSIKRAVLLLPSEAEAHDAARDDLSWGDWIRAAGETAIRLAAIRAQAVEDDCTATIALCDLALGRDPDDRVLGRLHPEAAARMLQLSAREARAELARGSTR